MRLNSLTPETVNLLESLDIEPVELVPVDPSDEVVIELECADGGESPRLLEAVMVKV